jgi:Tfp pilus assembly protein PilF
MSSKSGQRHRPHRPWRGQPPSETGVASPKRRWKLKLLLGLGFIATASWFGAKFWQESGRKSANLPLPSPAAYTSTPSTPAGRPKQNVQAYNARVNRGNQLLAEGKPAEAAQILTEAAQLNPEDEDVHYDLGLALARLGKAEEAIQQYEKALSIFPNYVEAHNNLGNLLMRDSQIEEAIKHFEAAIKIMPEYASAHNNLGTAFQRTGRTNEAIIHFREAVRINPDYWEAHFNVATSCLQSGRFDEARTEFERVLRLQPNFQPARDALAELKARSAAAQ